MPQKMFRWMPSGCMKPLCTDKELNQLLALIISHSRQLKFCFYPISSYFNDAPIISAKKPPANSCRVELRTASGPSVDVAAKRSFLQIGSIRCVRQTPLFVTQNDLSVFSLRPDAVGALLLVKDVGLSALFYRMLVVVTDDIRLIRYTSIIENDTLVMAVQGDSCVRILRYGRFLALGPPKLDGVRLPIVLGSATSQSSVLRGS